MSDKALELHIKIFFNKESAKKKSAGRLVISSNSEEIKIDLSEEGIFELPRVEGDHAFISSWISAAYKKWAKTEKEENIRDKAIFVGKRLFRVIFRNRGSSRETRKTFDNAWNIVQSKTSSFTKLRIRLQLPEQLTVFPWELMHYESDSLGGLEVKGLGFLAIEPDIAIVRYVPRNVEDQPLDTRPTGTARIVSIVAEPKQYHFEHFNHKGHKDAISKLEHAKWGEGRLALRDLLDGLNTMARLEDCLLEPVDILDIVCHGGSDQNQGSGSLLFVDVDGKETMLSSVHLRRYLQASKWAEELQLIFLKACRVLQRELRKSLPNAVKP